MQFKRPKILTLRIWICVISILILILTISSIIFNSIRKDIFYLIKLLVVPFVIGINFIYDNSNFMFWCNFYNTYIICALVIEIFELFILIINLLLLDYGGSSKTFLIISIIITSISFILHYIQRLLLNKIRNYFLGNYNHFN